MSSKDELKRWLTRPEKEFHENLSFAIKCWKSAEFTLTEKYEIILEWFTENIRELKKIGSGDFTWAIIDEFLSLQCSPGLIDGTVKNAFVKAMIQISLRKDLNRNSENKRKLTEVLWSLVQHGCLQDYLKSNYPGFCQLLARLLKTYEIYLEEQTTFLVGHETSFFTEIMTKLKEYLKNVGSLTKFKKHFSNVALQSLIEVVILLKSKNLNFFEDLLDIEKILYLDYEQSVLLDTFRSAFPIHVNLINFECAIVNLRGDVNFSQKFVKMIFEDYQQSEQLKSPSLMLTVSAYVLEMFKKYDIVLNFKMTDNVTVLQYLGTHIQRCVADYHEQHLFEVLHLLCSTLRLNPLILEKDVFTITTTMLTARKWETKEQDKFEEFLVLLMDMFKKLSRAEKFVGNLIRNVKEYLAVNKITKKGKRKQKTSTESDDLPDKKAKLDGSVAEKSVSQDVKKYLDALFTDFKEKKVEIVAEGKLESFSSINFAWPSKTVGYAFSKLVLSLMSKQSLVVWKTLVFCLKDLLEVLKTTSTDENTLFLIDFHCALLCQYFAGCRLHEHADTFWTEIKSNRDLTRATLKEFGQLLLSVEHNNRTMNAFQECAYYVGYFDLVLWYYRPDSLVTDEAFTDISKTIHDFLTPNEWVLIQQRIVNFGKTECKINLNRICLQRVTAKLLFHDRKSVNIQKTVLNSTFSDADQIKAIFSDPNNFWLLPHLKLEEQNGICELIAAEKDVKFIQSFAENVEFFEKIVINLYKIIAGGLKDSKKSILAAIDFAPTDEEKIIAIVEAFNKKDVSYSVRKYESEEILSILKILAELPIGSCRLEAKTVIFGLQLALYRDLIAAEDDNLASSAFALFSNILQFGVQIPITKHFEIEKLLAVIPPSTASEFYNFLFSTLKLDIDNGELFLEKILALLKANESELSGDHIKLLIIAIDTLALPTTHKKFKKHQAEVYRIYGNRVSQFFVDETGRNTKKDKKFVEQTLPAYATYINSVLGKIKSPEDLDENLRRICKIYIGYSMDCRNPNAIKLITVALNNRVALHFDPDEIEFVLKKYWDQLNEDLKSNCADEKIADAVIKLIISHKTNEDFLKTMVEIGKDIKREDFVYTCRILTQISKCHLSTIKGAIFNEHFKRITFEMILRLETNSSYQFTDQEVILSLLDCQKAICENTKIPISSDTLDDILSYLIDLNIKKFQVDDENTAVFNGLHQSMVELCTIITKYRHVLLMDRIPQLAHIFRDLLEAICLYKSNRQKDTNLSSEELDILVDLAMKMESLMHLIASHSLEVKRIAPYLLTFAISLMVSNSRPTTLYPKIKTHIENICYDLVSVCDHRVGRFILRCSNEASRQLYEVLCKEHKKYHKFKGKV